jgi:hypothetical protein
MLHWPGPMNSVKVTGLQQPTCSSVTHQGVQLSVTECCQPARCISRAAAPTRAPTTKALPRALHQPPQATGLQTA